MSSWSKKTADMFSSKCCPVWMVSSSTVGHIPALIRRQISRLSIAALMNCGRAPTIVTILRLGLGVFMAVGLTVGAGNCESGARGYTTSHLSRPAWSMEGRTFAPKAPMVCACGGQTEMPAGVPTLELYHDGPRLSRLSSWSAARRRSREVFLTCMQWVGDAT